MPRDAASALAAEEMIPVPPMNNTFVAAMIRLYRRVRQWGSDQPGSAPADFDSGTAD